MGAIELGAGRSRPEGEGAVLAGWAVVAAGAALLLLRPSLHWATARPAVLVLMYAGLLAACAAVPVPSTPGAVSSRAALAVGLAAVGLASLVAGPAPPLRVGAVAPAVVINAVAAVAEEALFRRVLYGRLVGLGVPAAVLGSAVAFAALHVPLYGTAALWVDLGAGLLLSWQRWASGSWTMPAATHAAANLLAVIR